MKDYDRNKYLTKISNEENNNGKNNSVLLKYKNTANIKCSIDSKNKSTFYFADRDIYVKIKVEPFNKELFFEKT